MARKLLNNRAFCKLLKPDYTLHIVFESFSRTICLTSLRSAHFEESQAQTEKKLKIGVQGAPVNRGQSRQGVEEGPRICRNSGFIEVLRDEVKHDIKDFGDLPIVNSDDRESTPCPKTKMKNLKDVANSNKLVSEGVQRILKEGRICVTLGGDHSIGIGTLDGVSKIHHDLAVLWIDAHCDLNLPTTSNSGNIHGMPLSFVLKELQEYGEKFPEFSWVEPRISAKNLAYIGLRDVDMQERLILDKFGITAFTMKDVDLHGIHKVTQMALKRICPGNNRPLHVSYDIDALDVNEVITTGTPVPGGLSLREGIVILEEVYNAGNMVALDFVEVNPKLGTELEVAKTTNVIKQLLINAFGYRVVYNSPLI